ncbi:enoyl-CoA hydratase-related protein [Amycolatopsis saalfeldensis]|uniref:Crotonobetainyl-CoA hydratase n=1 Tax=Amycolatopsis saalfeldensis TaxID=394193 RepID=A0A1H8T3A1_9PSEU|nr:enoyl-CoA hydratase-related protein [Amycolatopsis saalfeldensis]SEO85392.1 crotonobetainyl-CoA hydratase [Amycolatopsis saalfeldensis]
MTAASPSVVRTEVFDGVLVATIDRPGGNAMDRHVSRALYEAMTRLSGDPGLRAGVLTGAGREFFCAGWDPTPGAGGIAGVHDLFRVGKPLIAAVNGLARGGGFELALVADLIVAADHAEFALPDPPARVPGELPEELAQQLRDGDGRLTAAAAARWGLVHHVVPAGTELTVALDLAHRLAAAPGAAAVVKEIGRGAGEPEEDPAP